ncbi:MAG: Zn-dependent alcohol dehydrogenase [Rhodobacteraceae bacterium]|nr:Zn-dependent alcohol dehydrogenase [Paracoccaceae bacterium]MCW9041773.1 Zn-dependent alcohol dehydrogenase [Pseudopelagicola sp.]
MKTIKAAVCHEYGAPLVIEDIHLAPPATGEVEVTLDAVSICHSDISYWEGKFGGSLPAVYGHEAAGHITEVGPGVKGFEPGDHVIVTLIRACGSCPNCGSGKPTICTTPHDQTAHPLTTTEGDKIMQAMDCGAFAEKVVVDTSQIVKIPADMPKECAALISCGVITGVGAVVNAAKLRTGEDVVVIGAGGIGLNAIQGARLAGARRIVAVDMVPEKLEIAKDFGATDAVLASDAKPWRHAIKSLGKKADAVIVTVGAIQAYDSAPRYLATGGRIVMVGMPAAGQAAQYEPLIMSDGGQSIVGSKMGDTVIKRDIPWMVDLYQQGRLKLDELISGRWTLEQVNEAIADTKTGAAKRNVIRF